MSSETAVSPQQKVAGNLVLALGSSVWATHFLVTDTLLETWDPYIVTAGRLLSATVFLMAFYAWQAQGRPLRRIPWRPSLLLGSIGIALSTAFLTLGVQYAGPVPASIVSAAGPIVAAFVARIGFRQPLRVAVMLGAIVAVIGGILAATGKGEGEGGVGDLRGGELLILAAITIFTWYSLGAQRWMAGVSQLGITAITIMIGGLTTLLALPVLLLLGIAEPHYVLDWQSIVCILYLGAGPASFSLFCWHWGISRIGVTIASIYQNLVPVTVVAIRMIQGEPPTASHLIGGLLIISGVLIAQFLPPGPRRRKPGTAT
ncbi:MAG: DMT family transporter [Rhodospirillales bacterium]|nr:DMT family transporter [Rhodospirillales bacterium]